MAYVVFGRVCVENEVGVVLVDRVVGQVLTNVFQVGETGSHVGFGGESGHPFADLKVPSLYM